MTNRKSWLTVIVALIGGLIGGAAATILGASNAFALRHGHHAKTVEAERFVLLGPNGDQRGVMRVSEKGTAALYFVDADGKERGEFRVAADGRSSVGFYDSTGSRRVIVGQGVGEADESGIGVFSRDGAQIASLSSLPNGQVSLTLYDHKTGLARAGLGLGQDGAPALVLFDQDGKDRAELHLDKNGNPGLAFANTSGKTTAGLPVESPPPPTQ